MSENPKGVAESPVERAERESWSTIFAHAVRGTGGDPTKGPLMRAIVLLAVPMVLEMAMESVFAVVDIFFVSRLGDDAVAGVALTESVLTLVYTAAMGLGIGVTAMVARRMGEGDEEAAAQATVQAIILGVVLAAAFGVAGIVWAEDLLRVMGASPETASVSLGYTRVLLGANVVIVLLFLQNAAFRGAGDAATAMRVLWLANGLNIVLDPCLIFGLGPFPELGLRGAAIATTIGRGTAVVVQLYTLLRLSGRLRVRPAHVRLRLAVMARLVRLSATGSRRPVLHGVRPGDRRPVRRNRGGESVRRGLPPHRCGGVPVLRVRHGHHRGVQRSGGRVDADDHQLLLFLAVGDPARVGARTVDGARPERRLHRDRGLVRDARRGERRPLPAGAVEAGGRLTTAACRLRVRPAS